MRLLILFAQPGRLRPRHHARPEAAESPGRQLATVNEIGQALARHPGPPHLYRLARDGVRRLVDAPIFGISLFDPEQQTITAAPMAGGDAELDVGQFPPLTHVPDASPVGGRAIATAQPEIIPDLQSGLPGGQSTGCRRRTLHPLRPLPSHGRGGRVIGLLEVQSYR